MIQTTIIVGFILFTFVASILFVTLYFLLSINSTNLTKRFSSYLSLFTSGVMLALAFLEFIPEVSTAKSQALHMSEHVIGDAVYHKPYIHVLLGYLFMLLIERVLIKHEHEHNHEHLQDGEVNHKQKHKKSKKLHKKELDREGKKVSLVTVAVDDVQGSGIVMLTVFALHSFVEGGALVSIKTEKQLLFSLIGLLGHQISDFLALVLNKSNHSQC